MNPCGSVYALAVAALFTVAAPTASAEELTVKARIKDMFDSAGDKVGIGFFRDVQATEFFAPEAAATIHIVWDPSVAADLESGPNGNFVFLPAAAGRIDLHLGERSISGPLGIHTSPSIGLVGF